MIAALDKHLAPWLIGRDPDPIEHLWQAAHVRTCWLCRVSAIGGITPAKTAAIVCAAFGVRTAFQEGGENDPVNQLAAYHVDISSTAFGIRQENQFPPVVHEMMPGCAPLRKE